MSDICMLECLKEGCGRYPILFDIVTRLCKYYKKNKGLQNSLKVNLSAEEYTGLCHYFGNKNVKRKSVNIKRFLDSGVDEDIFIKSIFEISGIELNDEGIEGIGIRDILLRLELEFYELNHAIDFLSLNNNLFKKYSYEFLKAACKITTYLLCDNNEIKDFSALGANFYSNSKSIRKGKPLYNLVADLVNSEIYSGYDSSVPREKIFETVGFSDNPTAIKVSIYAPLIYKHKNGTVFDWIKKLWECGESAVLSMDNIQNITESECQLEYSEKNTLVTCENESPFNYMIRNEKIPVIYTAGYPNSAVKKLIALLSGKISQIHHWGDTDLHGFKIADIIGKYCDVKLWRCSIDDIKKNSDNLIKLNDTETDQIKSFLIKNPNFKFKKELKFTLENGWLEQEAFQLTMNDYQLTMNCE